MVNDNTTVGPVKAVWVANLLEVMRWPLAHSWVTGFAPPPWEEARAYCLHVRSCITGGVSRTEIMMLLSELQTHCVAPHQLASQPHPRLFALLVPNGSRNLPCCVSVTLPPNTSQLFAPSPGGGAGLQHTPPATHRSGDPCCSSA